MQSAIAAGATSWAISHRRSWAGSSSPAGFLDQLRDKVHDWTESLWDAQACGFRQNDTIGVNLLSTTDVAWLRYATNDPELDGGHRDPWIGYLERAQDPKTGVISYRQHPGAQRHNDGHAMWHTVRALNILGGKLLHFPHHLRKIATVDGLAEWFDAVDWDSPQSSHHKVLGLVPLLVNLNNQRWTETFYRKIQEQQNPATGVWPRSKIYMSRTFAYTTLHLATGRVAGVPERTIDSVLSLQDDSVFFSGKLPHFATMDATYVLVRLPALINNYRQGDARQALGRLAVALDDYYAHHAEQIMANPHWMLAVVHTFGLLQEAFPDKYPSQRPYRFDWDKPSMYHCDVIANEASKLDDQPQKA
jgi:hypothetical protein